MKTIVTRSITLATTLTVLLLSGCKNAPKQKAKETTRENTAQNLTQKDQEFLEDLERRNYQFFADAMHPVTGLVADRWRTDGKEEWKVASIASTGFGLAAHAIAAERGWISREEGLKRCRKTLLFLRDRVDNKKGFFYQFIYRDSGDREANTPASTIDNALLLAGAITAAQSFPDSDLPDIVNTIYNRMDWEWMLQGNFLLQHGWKPEVGFLETEWKSYSELMLVVLLGLGADQHAIPAACWDAWKREPMLEFKGEKFASYPPLFIHQYAQAYFDFRNKKDKYLDYWRNSQIATMAQIDYMKRLAKKYPEKMGYYGEDLWGLTASDSEHGYKDWGAPFKDPRLRPWRGVDGTLVPSAPGGALAMCPEQALHTLEFQKNKFGETIYGKYGFANAYNPRTKWTSSYCIGIDTGITLLMAENLRSGFVWEKFMSHPAAKRAFQKAGFTSKK